MSRTCENKVSTTRELPGERTETAGAATVACKKVMAMRHKDKRPIMIARCEGDGVLIYWVVEYSIDSRSAFISLRARLSDPPRDSLTENFVLRIVRLGKVFFRSSAFAIRYDEARQILHFVKTHIGLPGRPTSTQVSFNQKDQNSVTASETRR